jgi:hypothetical protein
MRKSAVCMAREDRAVSREGRGGERIDIDRCDTRGFSPMTGAGIFGWSGCQLGMRHCRFLTKK